MTDDRPSFDEAYRDTTDYFGEKPEKILVANAYVLDAGRPALDVGGGQGRNAFFMARNGVIVHAIDPSAQACASMDAGAREQELPVRAIQTGFEAFDPTSVDAAFESYGTICLFGLVQMLAREEIELLRNRVDLWSGDGTVVFVTGWTTDDPAYASCSRDWRSLGDHSFSDDAGTVRTFLERGAATRLFGGFEVIHHWEGMGPEHRHGDGPPQRHGMFELVVRR
jgi:cyclopropane fatty-acyl-phospholipid synthase-like methyltransferase